MLGAEGKKKQLLRVIFFFLFFFVPLLEISDQAWLEEITKVY